MFVLIDRAKCECTILTDCLPVPRSPLTQLDINNKHPERALFLPTEARRQWAFVPCNTTGYRHQSELLIEQEQDEFYPTANGQADAGASNSATSIDIRAERSNNEDTLHGRAVVAVTDGGDGEAVSNGDGEERSAKREGRKGRRERSQQKQEQPQQGKKRASDNEEGPHSLDSLR